MEKKIHNDLFYSVDGQYGAWSVYSTCSASCGTGLKTRTRKCSDPAPAHGGAHCVGNNLEAALCLVKPCPKPTPGNFSGQTLPQTNASLALRSKPAQNQCQFSFQIKACPKPMPV